MSEPLPRSCKGCGARLLFVKDAAGKVHPLDLKAPVFSVITDMTGEKVAERTDAYVSHFATCPKANDFSGSKRKQ